MNTIAILITCGREEEIAPGTETGYLTLGDTPIVVHSLKIMEKIESIDGIIIATSKSRVDTTVHMIKRYGFSRVKGIVIGGVNRQSTLKTVMSKLPEKADVVVIHEASRPFTARDVFEEIIKSCRRYGCAIAAHKLADAVSTAPKGMKAAGTVERNTAWAAQAPQAFRAEVLEKILGGKSMKIIDDLSEFVRKPSEVHLVESGPLNLKIRSSDDLALAMALINAKLV